MEIKKVVVGPLKENCYILTINDSCLIIDPGYDADKIKKEVGAKKVLSILITHYHYDHIGALDELKAFYKTNVIDYRESKTIKLGDFIFEIIETKGHKNDSVTYYFEKEKVMFVGDFIFKDSIGRYDLEGGNINDMKRSIMKIKKYDPLITLYPGHGDKTTIKREIENNLYFREDAYE